MRRIGLPVLFLSLAALSVPHLRGEPPAKERPRIDLNAPLWGFVVVGDHMYGVGCGDHLIDIDLKEWKVREVCEAGRYSAPLLGVAGGRACVLAGEKFGVIDLAGGKELWSVEVKGPIRGLGFVGTDRAFVRDHRAVSVFDAKSGKLLHSVKVHAREESAKRGAPGEHHLEENRLYVGTDGEAAVAVIDLERGEVVERIPVEQEQTEAVLVAGGKLFVAGARWSQGAWQGSLGCVDLKTKKYTRLDLPPATIERSCTLVPAPDSSVILNSGRTPYQYDPDGKLLGVFAGRGVGKVVGFWKGQAIVDTYGDVGLLEPRVEKIDPWVGEYVRVHRFTEIATELTITRDGDGYRLSGYDGRKFIEVEKGVLAEEKTPFHTISFGLVHFGGGREKQKVVLNAEFSYEQFYLFRKP